MRIKEIAPEIVELTPQVLAPGRLYISLKYRAAVHLCCCGCGEKVVTPLSNAEWRIEVKQGKATIYPSIGNWAMACQSHYWIRENNVIWSHKFSKERIQAVFERDQRDLKAMHSNAKTVPGAKRPTVSPSSSSPARKGERGLKALWRWFTR
jgi:hypothetical protein